jgi:hypothetical protein
MSYFDSSATVLTSLLLGLKQFDFNFHAEKFALIQLNLGWIMEYVIYILVIIIEYYSVVQANDCL